MNDTSPTRGQVANAAAVIVGVVRGSEDLHATLVEYAADDFDDLQEAAANFCADILNPALTEGWMPNPDSDISSDVVTALLRELLPTGVDWQTVDAIHEMMQELAGD